MISKRTVLELCASYQGEAAYLVGGANDEGYSEHDIDVVMLHPLDETSTSSLKACLGSLGECLHIISEEDPPDVFTLLGMDFIAPLKPSKTTGAMNELYDFEKLKELDWSYPWYLQPKYTGWHVQIHVLPSRVSIFTEGARDISKKLPNIVEALKDFPKETMLDAELVMLRGEEMQSQGEVQTYLTSKVPPEDYHMKLFLFDIMIHEGKDIRKKMYAERWKILGGFKYSDMVRLTKNVIIESFDSLKSKYLSVSTDEGFMLKSANMTYNREGMKHFYKWKKQKVLDAEVADVEKKENGYVYHCSVGGQDIGLTYVSDVKAEKGDIIQVQVDKVSNKDGKWSWYAPKVVGLSEKKTSDSKEFLESLLGSHSHPPAPENFGDEDEGKSKPEKEISKGSWVLQKHWWGNKIHYDFRLKKGKVMIGWTLTTDPRMPGHHLALEKKYHNTKWLNFEGDMKPGEPGNSTTYLTAHMKIIDSGTYELGERKPNIVHMILEGKKLKGHYILQKMTYAKEKKDRRKWTLRKTVTETLQAALCEEFEMLEGFTVRGTLMRPGPYILKSGKTINITSEDLKDIAQWVANTIIDFAHNMAGFFRIGKATRGWYDPKKDALLFEEEITNPVVQKGFEKKAIAGHSIDMDFDILPDERLSDWKRVKSITVVPKDLNGINLTPQSPGTDDYEIIDKSNS